MITDNRYPTTGYTYDTPPDYKARCQRAVEVLRKNALKSGALPQMEETIFQTLLKNEGRYCLALALELETLCEYANLPAEDAAAWLALADEIDPRTPAQIDADLMDAEVSVTYDDARATARL